MYKYIEEFIKYLEVQKNYSPNTLLNYKKDLDEYYDFLNDNNYSFNDMDYKKCTNYLLFLDKRNLKKTSISRRLSSLRTFYKYLVLNSVLETNPFNLVSSPKKEKRMPKFINYSSIVEIFNVTIIKTK